MSEQYKILVPTDFSGAADRALEAGITLAKMSGAELDVLHAAELSPHWVALAEKSDRNLYLGINKELDRARDELATRVNRVMQADVLVHEYLEFAKGHKVILEHAHERNNHLIVMGAHGITGLLGLALGSYTQKILHTTPLPVLVIKKDDQPFKPRKLAFVSDFDARYARYFSGVVDFAIKMGCEVHLLSVNTPTNFVESLIMEERMTVYEEKAPEGVITKSSIHNAFRLEEGLVDYCTRNEIDLISLQIYKKRHAWRVLGGTIQDLINHLHIPVLAIPEH